MKALHILTIVSALLMVFGMPVPCVCADTKPSRSHPPFRFRFLFNEYEVDPDDVLERLEFIVQTVDLNQPGEFRKLGENVPNTKWKLAKFQFKLRRDPETNEAEDASELTLINSETKKRVVLRLNYMTDTAAHPPKK